MLEIDDKIGDYQLVKFLGRGQYGEVWLAEKHLRVSTRKVRHALKFLSNLGEEVNLKAAEDEVDTWIEAGGHPNVMSVIDMLIAGNHIVIVSEYAEGGSLNDWLKKSGGKAPDAEQALEMMLGILRGIEHLHSRSVVHRDLKPDNILLQGDFPRITDFGISRIVSEGTLSTKPIGSPAYMAPESFTGSKAPQIDIWSAGVILYEMLTGKFPYEHEQLWLLIKMIQDEEPQPLPESVKPELRAIVERALQKDVGKRFQTAREMRLAIESAAYELKGAEQRHVATEKIPELDQTEQQISINTGDTEKFDAENLNIRLPEQLGVTYTNSSETLKDEFVPPLNPGNHPAPAEFSRETQPAPTAPVIKTDLRKIEETQDWNEIERKRLESEQADFVKISGEIENRAKTGAAKKKPLNLIAGIAAGVVALSLIGVLLWSLTGKSANQTNANSAQNKPVNSPVIAAPIEGMAFVPGGEFTMGRDDGKSEAEKPAHKVKVQPFYIDVYETTNEQYAEFVKAETHKPPIAWKNGNFPNGQSKYPVVGINWDDANAYAKWAKKRLPTEEEWEFAARGANNFLYPWGNDWKRENANVGNSSFTEVGKFKSASPFGVYDLSGNAWEWTASDFKAYPNGKLPESFVGRANLKTIRGGSFEATEDFATATYRIGWVATGASNYDRTGFRCAKDVEK